MRIVRLSYILLISFAVLWFATDRAAASVILGFDGLSDNNALDTTIGEDQLFVEVEDLGGGQVGFRFFNTGPDASSITAVYFDDGSLMEIASIVNDPGSVEFSEGAANPLDGAASINFNTSFSAESIPPNQPNGVNPGEELIVIFDLVGGLSFQDLLDALILSAENPGEDISGGLRIGFHVAGFASGGFESFINNAGTLPVPEPASLLIFLTGLAGLCVVMRRRKLA